VSPGHLTVIFPCFAAEIGDALSAFEQQRQQNSTILQQLTERDAALATLRAEKLALLQQLESASETVRTAKGSLNMLCRTCVILRRHGQWRMLLLRVVKVGWQAEPAQHSIRSLVLLTAPACQHMA
jgi:hypothetical protein